MSWYDKIKFIKLFNLETNTNDILYYKDLHELIQVILPNQLPGLGVGAQETVVYIG